MSPLRAPVVVLALAAICRAPAYSQAATTTDGTVPKPPTPDYSVNATGSGTTRGLRALQVSGRVMVDDGSRLESAAAIERVCNGTAHTEGYTDPDGYFSVTLGEGNAVTGAEEGHSSSINTVSPEPTTPSVGTAGTGNSRYMGQNNRYANCDLRARLGGYTSKGISLASRGPSDNPNIGIVLLRRMGESDGAMTVSIDTLRTPKEARDALRKGMDLAKRKKMPEAIAALQQAVKIEPKFAFAWVELGKAQLDSGHGEDGIESFKAAIRAQPRWPEPYLRISLIGVRVHNWRVVADATDWVLRLDPAEHPQTYFFNAVANFNLGHLDMAEKSARTAENLDTDHTLPQIEDLLGNILAAQHQYAEAAKKLRAYLELAPKTEDTSGARQRLAEMEKLAAEYRQSPGKSR